MMNDEQNLAASFVFTTQTILCVNVRLRFCWSPIKKHFNSGNMVVGCKLVGLPILCTYMQTYQAFFDYNTEFTLHNSLLDLFSPILPANVSRNI